MMQLACDADASGQKPVPLGGKIICISCSEMLHEVRVYYSGKLGTTNRRRHNSIMKNSHFKIRDGSVFKRCPKQGRLTRWLSRARSWCRPAEPPPRLRSRRDPRNYSSLRTKPASCGQSLSPGLFNDGTKQFSSSSPRPAPEDGPAPAVGSDLAQDQGGGEGRGKPSSPPSPSPCPP